MNELDDMLDELVGVMKLFLVERTDHVDYDEYDAAVVAAFTKEKALKIGCGTDSDKLRVKLIGRAAPDIVEEGFVLQSFQAG